MKQGTLFEQVEAPSQSSEPGGATVEVLPPADVLDTLAGSPDVNAVILDPWCNKGIGGVRADTTSGWPHLGSRFRLGISRNTGLSDRSDTQRLHAGLLAYLVLQELPVRHTRLALRPECLPAFGCQRRQDLSRALSDARAVRKVGGREDALCSRASIGDRSPSEHWIRRKMRADRASGTEAAGSDRAFVAHVHQGERYRPRSHVRPRYHWRGVSASQQKRRAVR